MTTLLHLSPNSVKKICSIFFILCITCFNFLTAQPTLGFNSILQGLSSPVDIKNAGDGSQRLFIAEQTGTIRIYKNGNLLSRPFLNVSDIIRTNGGEQGLLSIAFHPRYEQNGYFFIYYTALNKNVTLARYHVSATNPNVANKNSGVILFSYPKPDGFNNHNGGCLQFGKDGYLYVSIGDGGSAGDPSNNAQNGKSHFGKILRLDVNVTNAPYYKIPSDNPFVNDPNVLNDIWVLGLRNPWRWSFDRQTGNLWIGDVGQELWEEVDFKRPADAAASNFGWRCYEGNAIYNRDSCKRKSRYDFPIFQYHHDVSDGGATVIGGYVYRGSAYPQMQGYYICADYISANAWKIKPNGAGGWDIYLQKNVPAGIVSFGENEAGELFASTLSGNVYRVVARSNFAQSAPEAVVSKNSTTFIYPTLVDNRTITLILNDAFQAVRLLDMFGHEVMRKNLAGVTGKITLHLPSVNAGMYITELMGENTIQQKIYITR